MRIPTVQSIIRECLSIVAAINPKKSKEGKMH